MENSIKFNFTIKNVILLPIYAISYIVVFIATFVWEMFFEIPNTEPRRFYGFLRMISSVLLFVSGYLEKLWKYVHEIVISHHENICGYDLVCLAIALFALYTFFNFWLGLMIMTGFRKNIILNSNEYESEETIITNLGEEKGYNNIYEGMKFIDTEMGMMSTRGKANFLKGMLSK